MWSSEVIRVGSAQPPGVSGLGVDDEYGDMVVPGGAALVSSRAVVVAARCASSEYQAKRQQKANGHATEVEAPVQSLFFVFHNCSSLDFVANIRCR